MAGEPTANTKMVEILQSAAAPRQQPRYWRVQYHHYLFCLLYPGIDLSNLLGGNERLQHNTFLLKHSTDVNLTAPCQLLLDRDLKFG